MEISIIAAVAENNVIGKDNDLIWRLPDDMKFFKETTKGHVVIMGRKNWESIPEKFRPLPNRTNIVLTRNEDYVAEGAIVLNSLPEAIFHAAKELNAEHAFIIGGGEIYDMALTLDLVDNMYITEIHRAFEGDVYFPFYNLAYWEEVERDYHPIDEKHKHDFDFVKYVKRELE